MDSDEDFDPDFFSAVDQLVAQHQTRQSQLPPAHQRASQPTSPVPVAPGRHLPLPGLAVQQQQAPAGAPLQQINGNGGTAGYGTGQFQKPPLPGGRAQQQLQYGRLPPAQVLVPGSVPPGRVTLAAAELQAQAAAAASFLQHPQQQVGGLAPPAGDLAARLAQLQSELSRTEGQNKLLASNLQQKERELSALRQKAAALERSGNGGAPMHVTTGVGQGAPAASQRSAFAVGELQRQLDSLRQQLLFKEQEMDDLKRQHSERTERLRSAEASIAELRAQLRQQAAATAAVAEQQQAQGGSLHAAAEAAPPQNRPRSAGRTPSTSLPGPRSSGQKRRHSVGASGAGQSGWADAGAGLAAAAASEGTLTDPTCLPLGAAAAPPPPLLDLAVLGAANGLRSSGSSLMAQLLAACSGAVAMLAGAAPASAAPGASSAAAPTALLLRSQLSAAVQPPDADSMQFIAYFSQRVQQVACGMLPAVALLDSIGALVAASLAQLHSAGVHADTSPSLPLQRLRLLGAGLQVAQHLIELDEGCAAAAVPPGSGGGGTPSAGVGPAAFGGRPLRLSSRVSLFNSSGAAVPAPAAALAVGAAARGSSGPEPPTLPSTTAVVKQHSAVFASLGDASCGALLPVVLGAALWLGRQHEAVAAGALGTLLATARAMQGEGARAVLAPVFTTGAVELFMQPPALRLHALRLLHLLLEDASLAQLFEGSLGCAAAARYEPGPPTGTAGNGGGTPSSKPAQRGGAAGDDGGGGTGAVQVDGGGDEAAEGPWKGAADIAERLLESFSLDCGGSAAESANSSAAAAQASTEQRGGNSSGGVVPCAAAGAAAARAAMQLVAALCEARQHGILLYLLVDDACGAPGCMLANRLMQLAEAATALPGDEGATMLLCPLPWPDGSASAAATGAGGAATLLHLQAAWQERLRVAQEALTLLRGLLVDDSSGVAALDDLASLPAAARITLTTLSRLSRLEAPAAACGAAAVAAAGAEGGGAAQHAGAPAPPPALLAPWARAIGSSTSQPAIADAVTGTGGGGAPGQPGTLPSCSVEDVVYMARSMRQRVLARMQSVAMQQG